MLWSFLGGEGGSYYVLESCTTRGTKTVSLHICQHGVLPIIGKYTFLNFLILNFSFNASVLISLSAHDSQGSTMTVESVFYTNETNSPLVLPTDLNDVKGH